MPRKKAFHAIPPKLAKAYRFDLTHYFSSPADFEKGLAEARRLSARFARLRGSLGESAASLLKALRLNGKIGELAGRLQVWAMLRWSIDVRDTRAKAATEALMAEIGQNDAWLEPELLALPSKKVAAFRRADKGLARYEFWLENVLRCRNHVLSPGEERILAGLGPRLTAWYDELYNLLLDREDFGSVGLPEGGALHVRRQMAEAMIHEARRVRRRVYELNHAGYARYRDLYAYELLHQFQTLNEVARLRRFDDALHEAAFERWTTADRVQSLYEAVEARLPLYRRYQRLRRDRVKRIRKLRQVRIWDMGLQKPGFVHPRSDIVEGTAVVRDALIPLGDAYLALYDALMDPSNGRVDMVAGEKRSPGAFSTEAAGRPSVIYSYAYEGYADDLATIAHEAGHAIHADLMTEAKVPLENTMLDPGYVTEAFALVNELLLYDLLARRGGDEGVYFRERLVSTLFSLFPTVEVAALEWRLYRATDAGELATAEDLDRLTSRHGKHWSIWGALHPEMAGEWMEVMHFTACPLYYLNYVLAHLLGLWFYARLKRETSFASVYVGLIRNGFDRPPDALLADFCGVTMEDPEMAATTFTMLEKELEGLARVYDR